MKNLGKRLRDLLDNQGAASVSGRSFDVRIERIKGGLRKVDL